MKKILVLLLSVSLFAACNDDNPTRLDRDKGNTRDSRDRDDRDREGGRNTRDDDSRYDENDTRYADDYEQGGDERRRSNAGGWTSADKKTWRTACNEQIGNSVANARELCDCVLFKLEAEYANYREADMKGGEAAGKRMMQECIGVNGGGNGYGDEEDY